MCNTPDDFILAEGEVELRVLSFLYPLSIHTSHFYILLSFFPPLTFKHRRPPRSSLQVSPFSLTLTQGHCSCLLSSHLISSSLSRPLSLSLFFLSHTLAYTKTHTHTQPLPPACIYLFVIFPNSVWRMSDSLTLHSARLIERHNIYVAETANYPTIYHPDYLSDWKLLVHVIGIIWN